VIDRQRLSEIAHTDHPIAAPLADRTVERILGRALGAGDRYLLDLGCGAGHWLLRAASARPDVSGLGIDLDAGAIAHGRDIARAEGLAERIELRVGDASTYSPERPADCVLSVGAAHAFGGLLATLEGLRPHLGEGATVVVGDGFWEQEPTADALAVGFERAEYADLATTVDRVVDAGWAPIYGHVSTPAEWDDYEWSWSGSLTQWALDHANSTDRANSTDTMDALAAAQRHRDEWLRGYRGVLGFVTLVLRRAP
jgi:SAM-dependent methyltransferase